LCRVDPDQCRGGRSRYGKDPQREDCQDDGLYLASAFTGGGFTGAILGGGWAARAAMKAQIERDARAPAAASG